MRFGHVLVIVSSLALFSAIYATVHAWWGLYVAIAVALLDWVLLSFMTRMDIFITPTRIIFGMPIYKKNFALSTIEVGEIEKIPLRAGIGIHGCGSRWVYNAHLGQGVSLKTDSGTTYLLGSEQPERLLAALKQAVPATKVT